MNVNPAATGCIPSHFVFTDFDHRVPCSTEGDSGKVARSGAVKVEVDNGDSTAGFADGIVAFIVIGIGDEHIPFAVNHVRVEVVRAAGMVAIIP